MECVKSQFFFSIIVPIYNCEDYISACIESVINQGYDNYEMILIDDGSTDRSLDICEDYANRNTKIIVYHKENEGQLKSRQYGIEKACGDYLLFLDADDYYKPGSLKIINDTIQKTECDLLIFGVDLVENKGKVRSKWTEETCLIVLSDKGEIFEKVLSSFSYNSMCRKAVKNSCIQIIDLPILFHGEDLIQSIDIIDQAKKVAFIDQTLYCYRNNPKSVTNNPDYKVLLGDHIKLSVYVFDFLNSRGYLNVSQYNTIYSYYLLRFAITMKDIVASNMSSSDKKELLKLLAEDDIYKKLRNKGHVSGKYGVITSLLNLRLYNVLCIIGVILRIRKCLG